MERYDVAVIGAGPAGSSAAIALARRGYGVVLLDKCFFPREKLCGDFLNPVNRPLFEQLGITNELLRLPHEKIIAFGLTSWGGEVAFVPFRGRGGKEYFGLGLKRFDLDDLLLRKAESAGAAVKKGANVTGLTADGAGWSVEFAGQTTQDRLRAALLIGADGRNSRVAHRLGLSPRAERRGRFVACQLRLRHAREIAGSVQIHLFPGGYAGLVGLGEGSTNLCFTVERGRLKRYGTVETLVEGLLCQNPYLKRAVEGSEISGEIRSVYPVYFPPRRCYGNKLLLVGDAARVTEPVSGEGVYFALKSGTLAAEAVDAAFSRGDLSARQLRGYERACRKVFAARRAVNRAIRGLIYRPLMLAPIIRISAKMKRPLSSLVRYVCRPEAAA